MQQISYSLNTRAWLAHTMNMMFRVNLLLLGSEYWQKAYKEKDQIEKLNHDFVDKTESAMKWAMFILTILGVLLDTLCWKYRKYSQVIIYYEIITHILKGFVPIDHGQTANAFFYMQYLYFFILYSCNPGPDIIASTIAITIILTC